MIRRTLLALAALTSSAVALSAQGTLGAYAREHYVRQDHRIPMRDGKTLFTIVFTPKDTSVAYPILLSRTPYGADTFLNPLGPAEAFTRAGYIFAFQDVRGKFRSEGEFVDVRPLRASHATPQEIDESTDTYDTVDWLVKHIPRNNGRVGQYGISYLGFYSTMGILSGHPALKAVSPQAPVTDWFIGDDFHHNGALFLEDGFDFLPNFDYPRPQPTAHPAHPFDFSRPDAYRYLLAHAGRLQTISDSILKHRVPFWDSLMAHPNYDAFWKARTPLPHLKNVKPAVLTVGGWFDAEDLWGTLNVYKTIERENPGANNSLVMGPWWHAGWFLSDGQTHGDLSFPTKTADDYHAQVELPFFERWLKGKGTRAVPEAFVYETGANRWRTFSSWPPSGVATESFFLGAAGRLANAATSRDTSEEFTSDPAHPVPYIGGVHPERGAEYMSADQRFAAARPDVLVYETGPLTSSLTIAGPIVAHLTVSTTGTDADWVVKVIDVYPDDTADPKPNPRGVHMGGYQQLVRAEVMRGRFRDSFEHPVAFTPGEPTKVDVTLPDAFHTFKPGHRVMIQVQSSWFPLVDRNPQTFVDIATAKPSDFRKATHHVFVGGAKGSRIDITVLRTPTQ